MSPGHDTTMSERLARSELTRDAVVIDLDGFRRELAAAREHTFTNTEPAPLGDLDGWHATRDVISHATGRFFTVQGLQVNVASGAVPQWTQPIINQPEIGILGLLLKEFDGVLHCLVQLKAEPGNVNGIQISPTVQATRSNYMRVHGGNPTPYLGYFRDRARHRVILDVRQSEQGAWFLRKRNRNMIIEVTEPVEVVDGYQWLTIAQLNDLLAENDLVNMDTRSVLACIPFAGAVPADLAGGEAGFHEALVASWANGQTSRHSTTDVLSWITERRTATDIELRQVSLAEMPEWHYGDTEISHRSERFFSVIGVRVNAQGREVGRWDQPMFAARGTGLVAFLMTRFDGVPHVLVHARAEPGFTDVVELAPTVQCIPDTYRRMPRADWPPFLEEVLWADPETIRFDTIQSEEGGRFYRTRSRHVIVETDDTPHHPDFRWMTPQQLTELLRHSNYVNMQGRSMLACLRALATSGLPTAQPHRHTDPTELAA